MNYTAIHITKIASAQKHPSSPHQRTGLNKAAHARAFFEASQQMLGQFSQGQPGHPQLIAGGPQAQRSGGVSPKGETALRKPARATIKAVLILALSLLISSCVEDYTVEVDKSSSTVLIVDAFLTTDTVAHCVRLTTSVPYGGLSQGAPAVSGARVTLDNGSSPITLLEDGETGCYYTPDDYYGEEGNTYRLSIEAEINGKTGHYEAIETMPEKGIRADDFDYYKMMDSIWVFAIWGQDLPGIISHYGGELVVHGERKPYTGWVFIDGSDMFDGSYLECGEYLFYTCKTYASDLHTGHPAPTPLVKGDVVTLYFYSMADFFHQWFMSMATESFVHIPMFSPQPANIASNIRCTDKEDHSVFGVFGLANLTKISVTIDNPDRTRLDLMRDHGMFPFGPTRLY